MSKESNGKIYYSFDEIGQELFGLLPQKKVTNDKKKLESQREKFLGTCPYCKQPTSYVYGTNTIVCKNEKCRGKKIINKSDDGTEFVEYKPYIKILSDKGLAIGTNIFEEKDDKQ